MSQSANIANLIISELDHFQENFVLSGGPGILPSQLALQKEPFVAAICATNEDGVDEKLLICRGYIPANLQAVTSDAQYASYLAPFGRIVACAVGEIYKFDVPLRHNETVSHRQLLNWKAEFTPKLEAHQWDAINNRMEWVGGGLASASLRRFLAGEAQIAPSRERRINVSLPGQAILDPVQDDIFRKAFNSRVLIYGSPGTGKTTVLLKRLSQKTKQEFLTDAEKALFPKGEWREQDWLLFTPNDLLKGYLREALGKEMLPATDEHVKVYSTFRKEVLRELGVLRVGSNGVFRALSPEVRLLKRHVASEYKALSRAFSDYLELALQERYKEAYQEFNNRTRSPLGNISQTSQELLQKALTLFQNAHAGATEMNEVKRLTESYTTTSNALNKIADIIRAVGSEQDQGSSATFLRAYLRHRSLVNGTAQLDTAIANIPQLVDYQKAKEAALDLRSAANSLSDALSLRRLIELAPRSYAEFRRDKKQSERFFEKAASDELAANPGISEPEQDVLLFHLLDVIRSVMFELPYDRNGVPTSVRAVLDRLKTNVCIDEVTDFSPLEIACMEKFTHPKRGGVTVCGDLMQRVTRDGIKDWADLNELSDAFEMCELSVGYRQTPRLFEIAKRLFEHTTGTSSPFKSAYQARPTDPPPLAFKTSKKDDAATWLSERVFEIFELCDNVLPTIAVLVPTQADVTPLKEALRPKLSMAGIEVDASEEGRSLGDGSRVRIFPVESIKGLEFEAVFYVGIDLMAEVHKELIDKYFYVGLSRARSLLGVTFEGRFPQRLDCVKQYFEFQSSFGEVDSASSDGT